MVKKGQAAMEFLMTYGWAILVVLVAIGALAYFGVLRPTSFLPESCVISPGYSCESFVVRSDGSATIAFRNGGADTINSITMIFGTQVAPPTSCNGAVGSVLVGSVQICTWSAGALGALTIGDKFTDTITLQYLDANNVNITKTGQVALKVAA